VTLPAGTRLGPYEVLSPLGAGGMGEVYKARDIRLDRFVALKILPADVASDRERLRRFEQEARAASALNHPNILVVHDVGAVDSTSYIVTELIEGKTLRDLLLKGPLPVKKLLDIAVQIADGLASAHEAGIAHRDLKPANIMISKDGFAKILDFGLAKSPKPAPKFESGGSDSVTETLSETESGALVGTVDYMSPEQASGDEVDYRSDQFAFGAILYEMVVGKRPFRRKNKVETLSAIIRAEPERVAGPRPAIPRELEWLIERCLAKKASERYVATRDLAHELAAIRDHLVDYAPIAKSTSSNRRVVAASGIMLLAALAVIATIFFSRNRDSSVSGALSPFSFLISAPENTTFSFGGTLPAPLALSPDGRSLAFGAVDRGGKSLLWVRSLRELTAKPLGGSEGATYPFWSPDSRYIAFFADGRLRKIDAAGGPVQTICAAREGRGGDWGPNGIVFAPDSNGPLFTVASSGGEPQRVTSEKVGSSDFSHRWPHFLPDGNHFLYLAHFHNEALGASGIYLGSLGIGKMRRLLPDLSNVSYASPGFLLFVRRRSLMAAGFDFHSLRLTTEPIPVVDKVAYHGYRWSGSFSVSRSGILAFLAGDTSPSQLRWFARDGRSLGSVGKDADYEGLRLSKGGDRCAVEIRDVGTGGIDIWVMDLDRGVVDRFTSSGRNIAPVWSPDDREIVFTSNRDGRWNLFTKSTSGSEVEQQLVRSEGDDSPTDWSAHGGRLLFNHLGMTPKHRYEIWSHSLARGEAAPLLRSNSNEQDGVLSPDGNFVAYVSDETGGQEVYVCPLSSPGERRRISQNGGAWPLWRSDGKELYYLSGSTVMATAMRLRDRIEVGETRTLFNVSLSESASNLPPYCPASDGSRFLVVTNPTNAPITVIPDWVAALRAK
jgi:eukaryotic-like serine/threonine-protein kinase